MNLSARQNAEVQDIRTYARGYARATETAAAYVFGAFAFASSAMAFSACLRVCSSRSLVFASPMFVRIPFVARVSKQ